MPRENDPSRFERERLQLWLRGCVLTGVIGLLAVSVLSTILYLEHRRPLLNMSPERINPNTATMAGLVRLPGIGKARAMDVIYYRQHYQQSGPAFQSPQDLEQIRGIGPKTAEKLVPWLIFNAKDATVAGDANVNGIKK